MPYGYTGKILHVYLSTGVLEIEEPPESFYRTYLGGSAMGLHYLLRHMPPGADPLGPENVLALCTGVITGAPISGQSRLTAVAKSPLTGCVADSQSGGFFPAELKFAGFDGVIISGRAEKPVYLWLHEGQAELRDASHLWGHVTGETEDLIKAELGDDRVHILQVGPAGESLVRFSAIMSMSNRAHGRTGTGAVMGSKNLKAIVARGDQKLALADPKALLALTKAGAKALPESDIAGLAKYGTAETTAPQQQVGGLPAYNFASGVFASWEAIDGTTMYDTILKGVPAGKQNLQGRDTCYSCTVRCKRVVEITEGPYQVDPKYGGPEYETTSTFGSYCGIDNLPAIAKANEFCNKYGLDTISCGATIAWAMECFEAGLFTLEDTGGLDLHFGNAEAMVRLTEMIGQRKGFGALLGEGSARAAQITGRGTEDFLITSKGQETPAHMPQLKPTLSMIYAVNPFGADHQSSEHDAGYRDYPARMAQIGLTNPQPERALNEEMVHFALTTQYLYSAMDSINVCQFVYGPAWQLYDSEQLAAVARAVTGWDVTVEELLEVGERRLNMLRLFNAREGIGRERDTLPKKFFSRPLQGGRSDGYKIDQPQWQQAVDTYYRLAGWDLETGHPTAEKLETLGLGWAA